MKKILLLCTTALLPSAAFAQSTGTVEFEKQSIVVTGTRAKSVAGVQLPDTPKAKVVITQEAISRQAPGQTILDTINQVPGVSFQNNDATGATGGTLTIRGFDSSRISLTVDGIPLNDSGNYAIFSGQQLDPELIDQVNVNLGTTDVDSPTASAVGGTVNYRSITPTREFGFRGVGTIGDYNIWRVFGLVNTGEFGPWHTRAWLSASKERGDLPFNDYGKIDKKQFNGKIWQPIGSNGDFISVAGHWDELRNNFFGSLPLRTDTTRVVSGVVVPRVVGPNTQNRYPRNADERFYAINFPCTVDTPQAGVADSPGTTTGPGTRANDPTGNFATCGTEFDRRYNPANTGNIRAESRFTLADNLILTVDPSYQYVKANGGGTLTGNEGLFDINPAGPGNGRANCRTTPNGPEVTCVAGFFNNTPFFGRDINGDGDTLDTVTVLAPSQTHTDRYGVVSGLRWDFAPHQTFRVGYTLDDAHHVQTGEVGLLQTNGEPVDVFPRNNPEADVTGTVLQKRDRVSFAVLHQLFGEYRGDFGHLTVDIGLTGKYFIRNLHNFCFTTSASGFVDCTGENPATDALYAALNPTTQGPQKRRFTYKKLLPNIGLIYDLTPALSVFGNYSKNLSVPSTDNLYNSFFFAPTTSAARPKPEITDSFDGGFRYRTSRIQAQLSGWYTHFTNREAQAFDPELNVSVFRNLGTVNKWGIDGSIAYEPFPDLTLYAFGSWMRSKIEDNIQTGPLSTGVTCDTIDPTTVLAVQSCAFTAGNRESGAPKYTFGGSAVYTIGPFDVGFDAKRTGPRFVFDNNQPVFTGPIANPTQVFPAKAPAYWLVNLNARMHLARISPTMKNTYLQLNIYNLFDKFYVGGFGGGLTQTLSGANYGNPPFVQIGAPRTVMASINVQF